ncbi:pilus assembly PilX N-terminal domain-containing protein [candidate division NPL-UPA2 bacterium]|nr:pilus assembly PilX N-terminal domain-containing protein [candidate division NPL-UPA2 bacterium]
MLRIKNEKGMAAIVAFSVLFILLTLGAIFLFSMDTEFKIATNQKASTQALYIAEAGLQYGLGYLRNIDPGWRTNGVPVVHQLANGQYSVEAVDELDADGVPTGWVLITSTGEVDLPGQGVTAKRIVRIKASCRAVVKYVLQSNGDIRETTTTGTVDWSDSEGVYAKGKIYIDPPHGNVTFLPDSSKVTENGIEDIPGINMAFYKSKAEIVDNNHVFTGSIDNKLFYVLGDCVIDTTHEDAAFSETSIIAEGNIEIIGGETLTMGAYAPTPWRADEFYPVLASLKNITESGSIEPSDRLITGLVIASPEDPLEPGVVHFENIALAGAIIGRKIELTGQVEILYDEEYGVITEGGLIGFVRDKDWQEIY